MTKEQNRVTFELRDEYQRKPIAEKIIRLLESDTKVSPLVIDGSWGAGKTEFCRKLIHLIEDKGLNLKPIYVDAFKADHADEPLMTLMAAVLKALPEETRDPLMKKALPVIKFGIKTGLKAGVSLLLRQDATDLADDFEADLKNAGDEVINHAVESLLTDHIAAEEGVTTLQAALCELAAEAPIVVFIDELDRCRPDFSVNMLENIKHVFEVEGVQFVLIANFDQLRTSINHCYGSALDAQRYLDRFVSFRFNLSETHKPNGHEAILASVSHLNQLVASSDLLSDSSLKHAGVMALLHGLVEVNHLSLREVETLVRHLEIYQSLTEENGIGDRVVFGYCLLRILGVFLFCFRSDIAKNLNRGFVDVPAIASSLGKTALFNQWEDVHPDGADAITAMICLETQTTDKSFSIATEEERQNWMRSLDEYFNRGFGGRSRNYSGIICEAIDALTLVG